MHILNSLFFSETNFKMKHRNAELTETFQSKVEPKRTQNEINYRGAKNQTTADS